MKKVATFADRLSKVLKEKNMKPIRLAEHTGISKSAISQYLSGSFVPKHAYVSIIADALGVDEFWLMGYADARSDPRLSLEDIRKINKLTKDDMARIMDVSKDEYDYLKDHVGEIKAFDMMRLCSSLEIGIKYITI